MMTDQTLSQTSVDNTVIRDMPILQRIDWLMEHARRHSVGFQSPESFLARSLHMAQHPTAVIALSCMDGRINISVATGTPDGIIVPLRNLGGRFDLGWPHFGQQNSTIGGFSTLSFLLRPFFGCNITTRAA